MILWGNTWGTVECPWQNETHPWGEVLEPVTSPLVLPTFADEAVSPLFHLLCEKVSVRHLEHYQKCGLLTAEQQHEQDGLLTGTPDTGC